VTSPRCSSVFAGFRFPQGVIAVAVRWYLHYGLSYRPSKSCWPSAASPSIT
jgi:transposase-like protein